MSLKIPGCFSPYPLTRASQGISSIKEALQHLRTLSVNDLCSLTVDRENALMSRALPEFKKNPGYFDSVYGEADWEQSEAKRRTALYTDFYSCVAYFETNFAKIDLNDFTVNELILFLMCDGFHAHKQEMAECAKRRLLQLPPYETMSQTSGLDQNRKKSICFQNKGKLDAIFRHCVVTEEEKLQLYRYEHPSTLLERSCAAAYQVFSSYPTTLLSDWLSVAEKPEIDQLGSLCKSQEKEKSLSSKIIGLIPKSKSLISAFNIALQGED